MSLSVREVPRLSDQQRADEDREVIKDLESLFKQAKEDRQQVEPQWLLNFSFYLGQQWVFVNDQNQRIERPRKLRKGQVLMTVNLVKGTVRTEYAKLVQTRPQAKAQPASPEPEDRDHAKVCDALLAYLDATDGSERAQKRALLWAIVTGTGILETYWNKDKGEILRYPETTVVVAPDPETGEGVPQEVPHPRAGQPVTDQRGDPVHLGDVETCEVSPFEFYPDPFGLTIEDKNWAFTVKVRSAEWVMERYGVSVEPHDLTDDQMIEGQLGWGAAGPGRSRRGVVVKTFRQRQTKKHADGRYVVYVDDKVLYQGPNPYPKCPLPFASFVHIPVPGRFWGDSMVTDIIDPQRNLNKSRSQSIEQRNMMARGRVIVIKGALDVGQTISNTAGEVVEVNPVQGAAKPVEFVDGTPINDAFWKDIEQSKAEIREVSGSHEVSNGQVPGGVTAARAIGYLQEQDDMRLGPTAQEYEDAISRIGKYRLCLAKQFYDEPRTIRVVGKDMAVQVVHFTRDDIPEDVDVHVETGSSLPKSRVARQHFIREMWKDGMLPSLRVALRLMELGDVEGLYQQVDRDINQATRENEAMKNGQEVVVAPWHNHAVHMEEHRGFMKGEEYEALVAQDPQLGELFLAHDQQHQQAQQVEAQTAAMNGAPPPNSPEAAIAARSGAPTTGTVGQEAPMPDLTT